eukprot:TRINITY_DN21503_c0_g1_i5.p2 TRINITY_DN21503_c0_g1~~TRINITY_DN21503_c0_g1_i5.p2  ORF type:complete len:348 (-),score=107.65 TRINITY_DN21503_c0_g1_i5:355-1398(-)
MSAVEWRCKPCKKDNYFSRDTCRACGEKWKGNEKTIRKERSSSAKRRENKASSTMQVDKVAQRVVQLLKESGNPATPTADAATTAEAEKEKFEDGKKQQALVKPAQKPSDAEKKINESVTKVEKIIKEFTDTGGPDSAGVMSLKVELRKLQERRDSMHPLENRIERQSELLVKLVDSKSKIEENTTNLQSELVEISTDIVIHNAKLQTLQAEFHRQVVETKKLESTVLNKEAKVEAAVRMAKESGDADMYRLLTGEELARGSSPASSSVLPSRVPPTPPTRLETAVDGYHPTVTALAPFKQRKRQVVGDAYDQNEEITVDAASQEVPSTQEISDEVFREALQEAVTR